MKNDRDLNFAFIYFLIAFLFLIILIHINKINNLKLKVQKLEKTCASDILDPLH